MTASKDGSKTALSSYETLFHAFPRRGKGRPNEESERGLAIMRSILKSGLLITPEVVQWRLSISTEPTYTAQKRVCFTALSMGDFSHHAALFGRFAVGFEREQLERLGATPVFYVPRHLPDEGKGRNIGSFYIEKLVQLQLFLDNNPRSFKVGHTPVTTRELGNFTRFLTGLFYPIEEIGGDPARAYFAQREWRILGNLFIGKHPLSRPLSDEEKAETIKLDTVFFGRQIQLAQGFHRLIDQCAIVDQIEGIPLRQAITDVAAPERDRASVEALLDEFGLTPSCHWVQE